MVVGPPRGGGGSGGVDEGKVCSVAWQRQHGHHQHQQQLNSQVGVRQAALGGEVLPVVELKPFTRKVRMAAARAILLVS